MGRALKFVLAICTAEFNLSYGKNHTERSGQSNAAPHHEESQGDQNRQTQTVAQKVSAEIWTHLLHELGTIIGGVAAVIAAASSLKNGRTLKNGQHDGTRKRVKKKTSNEDWYQPPSLN